MDTVTTTKCGRPYISIVFPWFHFPNFFVSKEYFPGKKKCRYKCSYICKKQKKKPKYYTIYVLWYGICWFFFFSDQLFYKNILKIYVQQKIFTCKKKNKNHKKTTKIFWLLFSPPLEFIIIWWNVKWRESESEIIYIYML